MKAILGKLVLILNYYTEEYIEFGVEHVYPHNHNPKVWVHCERQRHLCADWEFLSKTCNSVSIQLMKAVRFRLSLAESLLSDDALNLRVLFLVRDPRGSLLSRRNLTWCQKSPDCFDTSRVCADMVADFKAGAKLRDKYPGQIKCVIKDIFLFESEIFSFRYIYN